MTDAFQVVLGGFVCLGIPALAVGWALWYMFKNPANAQHKRDVTNARYGFVRGEQQAKAIKQAFLEQYGPDEYYRKFGTTPDQDGLPLW